MATRRTHRLEFKQSAVEASRQLGASIAGVAMAHGINANQLHKWRRLFPETLPSVAVSTPTLIPITVVPEAPAHACVDDSPPGLTDMRRGFDGLAALIQEKLGADPFSGHVFVFRGRRGDRIKLLWWDGDGLCLFAKRLEHGRFVWPQATEGAIHLTTAQLSMLLEGIDWRRPERPWKPRQSA